MANKATYKKITPYAIVELDVDLRGGLFFVSKDYKRKKKITHRVL